MMKVNPMCVVIDICGHFFDLKQVNFYEKYASDIHIWNEMINACLRHDFDIAQGKHLLVEMQAKQT